MGNSFEHATFPEEGMGKPWPRTSPRRFIIAIDLGATYSAVTAAYLNPGDLPVVRSICKWPGTESEPYEGRVPTVLLYNRFREAQEYGTTAVLKPLEASQHRVDQFKLHLHSQALSSRGPSQIEPRELPAGLTIQNVYTDMMAFLINHASTFLIADELNLWNQHGDIVEFILTHPNIWGSKEQSILKQALVDANLITEERVRDNVHFIEEGEAAARFSIADYQTRSPNAPLLKSGQRILVCDLGGSTADLVTYTVVGSKSALTLKEVDMPSCVAAGGISVDRGFQNYLHEKMKKKWEATTSPKERAGDYELSEDDQALMVRCTRDFEQHAKRTFESSAKDARITAGTRSERDPALDIALGTMTITGKTVEDKFFRPTLDPIIEAVKRQITKAKNVDIIMLTGGFGESPYVQREFREQFMTKYTKVVIRGEYSANKPVAQGALMIVVGRAAITVERIRRPFFVRLFNRRE